MRLIVQTIGVTWTKASRGAPGATQRAAVPDVLPLPDDVVKSTHGWHHELAFDELHGFAETAVQLSRIETPYDKVAGMRLEVIEDRLKCWFCWQVGLGAPERPKSQFAFTLEGEQSARAVFQGRLSDAHGWRYQRIVQNIAWVETCSADVFVDVDHQFRSAPKLW